MEFMTETSIIFAVMGLIIMIIVCAIACFMGNDNKAQWEKEFNALGHTKQR
jgi:hypothetical protein